MSEDPTWRQRNTD